jgi:dihydrofolate reductase
MKYIIVGYDHNRAIGAHNTLPWAGMMRTDMQRVKQLTTGNAIIMGRKTFESIGRALPDRQNIVISHHEIDVADVTRVSSLDEAYAAVEPGKDAYIFGGGKVYQSALDTVDEILATEIDTRIDEANTYFPVLDDSWQETSREHHDANDADVYDFDFVTYKKVT